MKKHFFLLFSLILLSSCSPFKYGKLSDDNFVYIDTPYKTYLTEEIAKSEENIIQIQRKIESNQGNRQFQSELQKALKQKAAQNSKLKNLPSLKRFLKIVPPKPPCPIEGEKTCFPKELKYLVFPFKNLKQILILNENGEEVENISHIHTKEFPGSKGRLSILPIETTLPVGNLTVRLKFINENKKAVELEIDAIVPR